jgi:hypothetical protein
MKTNVDIAKTGGELRNSGFFHNVPILQKIWKLSILAIFTGDHISWQDTLGSKQQI